MAEMRIYRVDGMTCEGCVRAVTNAIRKERPSAQLHVDLALGTVAVDGGADDDAIRRAIERAGFDFRGAVPAG
jgi:copper chaperone